MGNAVAPRVFEHKYLLPAVSPDEFARAAGIEIVAIEECATVVDAVADFVGGASSARSSEAGVGGRRVGRMWPSTDHDAKTKKVARPNADSEHILSRRRPVAAVVPLQIGRTHELAELTRSRTEPLSKLVVLEDDSDDDLSRYVSCHFSALALSRRAVAHNGGGPVSGDDEALRLPPVEDPARTPAGSSHREVCARGPFWGLIVRSTMPAFSGRRRSGRRRLMLFLSHRRCQRGRGHRDRARRRIWRRVQRWTRLRRNMSRLLARSALRSHLGDQRIG